MHTHTHMRRHIGVLNLLVGAYVCMWVVVHSQGVVQRGDVYVCTCVCVCVCVCVTGHQTDVDVVGWHPNCAYVATASSDRSVRLWDVATGTCVRFLTGLRSPPTCMAIHPDGKHVS